MSRNSLPGPISDSMLEAMYARPVLRMPEIPKFPSIWEVQAEMFKDGLQHRLKMLQERLADDQELVVTATSGGRDVRVTAYVMPSENTVVFIGEAEDGSYTEILSHLSSVNLRFEIRNVLPPQKPRRFGFSS